MKPLTLSKRASDLRGMSVQEHAFLQGWDEMSSDAHTTAMSKGWWEGNRSVGEIIALMHSELSEALEVARDHKLKESDPSLWVDQLAEELADCIIRIADFAQRENLPVAEALIMKARYNKQRPYRHGKAF